jgi:hypothetical protein
VLLGCQIGHADVALARLARGDGQPSCASRNT